MSELYDSIPIHRRDAYLSNAETAFNEAVGGNVDPIIAGIGELVIRDAELIIMVDAGSIEVVADGAEEFLEAPDLMNDRDRRYLLAYDVANRRARGEEEGKSFMEVVDSAAEARAHVEQEGIEKEFAEKYQATEEL